MKKFLFFLLDMIIPCRCVSCGIPVSSLMNHLCSECFGSFSAVEGGCIVCSGALEDGKCTLCGDRKFYPSRNISLFSYEKTSRDAVYSLKFGGMKSIYKNFIPAIISGIGRFDEKIDIITAVPMNRKKVIKRGFNQSELMAKRVSRLTGIRYCGLLKENRNTEKQRDLNYTARFINVIDRYESLDNNIFKDKNVLIIDDVLTTGATINECSRKLIRSGAARVFSITVVRSDLKKLENL